MPRQFIALFIFAAFFISLNAYIPLHTHHLSLQLSAAETDSCGEINLDLIDSEDESFKIDALRNSLKSLLADPKAKSSKKHPYLELAEVGILIIDFLNIY